MSIPTDATHGIDFVVWDLDAFAFGIVGIDFVVFMTKDSKFNTMRLRFGLTLRFGLLVLTLCFS